MSYSTEDFLTQVKIEAEAIKEHATPEEIGRLDFHEFDAGSPVGCIYGQMTGHCSSHRAHQLIAKCCKKLVDNRKFSARDLEDAAHSMNGIECNLENLMRARKGSDLEYMSTVESYIMLPDAKSAELIDFLKGNRKDLVL